MEQLKILFVMRSKIYLRNFESVIRALAEAAISPRRRICAMPSSMAQSSRP